MMQSALLQGVRERKQWEKGEGLPAPEATTTTDSDPVVVFIVGLPAATSTADDGIAFTTDFPMKDSERRVSVRGPESSA